MKQSSKRIATPPQQASPQPAPLPKPGDREKSAIQGSKERVKNRRPRVSLKLAQKEGAGSTLEIGPRHSDGEGWSARIRDAFGTTSLDFAESELGKIAHALAPRNGSISQETANALLAVIDGARPRDEVEAMLVGQMAVTHAFALQLMGRAKRGEEIPQFDSAGNMTVKLLRTFTAQIEALAKLRRGGEQTVRVEHVHVYPGGQAVVGNVTTQRGVGRRGKWRRTPRTEQPASPCLCASASICAVNVRNSFTAMLPAESNCGISSTRFARPINCRAAPAVAAAAVDAPREVRVSRNGRRSGA